MNRILALAALCAAANLTIGCGQPCTDSNGVSVCGDFGEVLWISELSTFDGPVLWPPVVLDSGSLVLSRGNELVEVDVQGDLSVLVTADGDLSPPSLADDGTIYAVAGGATPTVIAIDSRVGSASRRFSDPLSGEQALAPPSIGETTLHVTTTDWSLSGTTSVDLDLGTLQAGRSRDLTSPIAVAVDDTLRYLIGAVDCDDPHDALVAESAAGVEMWRYTDSSGILDFAPGGAGESYIVTGNRELVRVSADGDKEWSFRPACESCNVAAAPTVTDTALYFPVWEGWVPQSSCTSGVIVNAMGSDAIDPLYAISLDGQLLWTYDGFATVMTPVPWIPISERTVHHPSGRPAVTADGTLYVATDGAVVSVDSNGNELGRALYDSRAGETTGSLGGTWYNFGITPAPVLSRDGTLFVWDGTNVRAFATGRVGSDIPWVAPFGGPSNDGRVR